MIPVWREDGGSQDQRKFRLRRLTGLSFSVSATHRKMLPFETKRWLVSKRHLSEIEPLSIEDPRFAATSQNSAGLARPTFMGRAFFLKHPKSGRGTSGNGVVVLPTLQKIGAAQCPGCNNVGHVVVMRRIVIGNNSLFQTNYGSPTSSLIDATTGYVKNYSSDAS